MLKPQDILVALKLVALGKEYVPFHRLAVELGMSPSEVHQAVERASKAGLIRREPAQGGARRSRAVNRGALTEFLLHGLRYVFPPERGGETRGIPTAHAAPPLAQKLSRHASRDLPPVWPDANGDSRGLEFSPLYRSAPHAAKRDPVLYELLALVDAVRGGRARERQIAGDELKRRLAA